MANHEAEQQLSEHQNVPQHEGIFNKRLSRRGALGALASTGVGAIGLALVGCGDEGESKTPGSEHTGSTTEITSSKEFQPDELELSLDFLPGDVEEITLENALPQNLVLRKNALLKVRGVISKVDGKRSLAFSVTDPSRLDENEQPETYVGTIPDAINAEKKEGEEAPLTFQELAKVNGAQYSIEQGRPKISTKDGTVGFIPGIARDGVDTLEQEAGIFFVDRDPLRKDHPLLKHPVIKNPDKSILPEGGSIVQLEDGRVVTKDSAGKVIARAITQRDLDWRWTKKEHLINEYSWSELSDANDLIVGSHAYPNKGDAWKEAFLSIANKVKLTAPIWNIRQFNPGLDWKKIISNWDDVEAQFKAGKVPFDEEIFNLSSVAQVNEVLDFAEKYGMKVLGGNLVWFGDMVDELKSSNYTVAEKRKIEEFMAKARVVKYKGRIHEWNVSPELIYNELWAPTEAKQMLKDLGGRQMFHDAHRWVKDLDPEARTVFVEDRMLDANYAPNVDYQKRVFDLLAEAKRLGTPLDTFAPENNLWIYAPPEVNDSENVLQRIEDMGFDIGMAQTVIEQSEKCSTSGIDRPRTVPTVADKDSQQAKITVDLLKVYNKKGKNGNKREFGWFSVDDATGWFGPAARSQLLGDNFTPKLAYTAGVKYLKDALNS